jgi:hypothetical protein
VKKGIYLILLIALSVELCAQGTRQDIYSGFVLYNKRTRLEKDIRENIIARTFAQDLDTNNEHRFESACLAVSQFLIINDDVTNGFSKLAAAYHWLNYDTKRAFLEAVYAVWPSANDSMVKEILSKETDPKLFSMCAVYLFRADSSVNNTNTIKIKMVEKFPGYDTLQILVELEKYLNVHQKLKKQKTPDIGMLFDHQRMIGRKIIYSFQRWNRDYPGIAIVQKADGSFVRDGDGKLQIFQQLARSASDLPYFITNGSTPQGVYSLQGTAVANNNYIGPTPNLQLIMPFENSWDKYFQQPIAPQQDSLLLYKQLLPPSWRNYVPMMEAWNAGKIGRTEIIAHGSTIDPEYYRDKPFYPLTPTMGCLCAKELWNVTTGRLLISEQFNLVSAFNASAGNKGYLFVINIDDQQKAVSREEVEALVRKSGKR